MALIALVPSRDYAKYVRSKERRDRVGGARHVLWCAVMFCDAGTC